MTKPTPAIAGLLLVLLGTAGCSGGSANEGLGSSSTCAAYNDADGNAQVRLVRQLLSSAGRQVDSGDVANALGTASYTCGTNPDFVMGNFTFANPSVDSSPTEVLPSTEESAASAERVSQLAGLAWAIGSCQVYDRQTEVFEGPCGRASGTTDMELRLAEPAARTLLEVGGRITCTDPLSDTETSIYGAKDDASCQVVIPYEQGRDLPVVVKVTDSSGETVSSFEYVIPWAWWQ